MNKDQKLLAEKYNQVLLEYDDKTYVLVFIDPSDRYNLDQETRDEWEDVIKEL